MSKKTSNLFTISKEFHFSASHQLEGLAPEHPCSRLHGHNYIYKVTLKSPHLNPVGFVLDYKALEPIKRWVDDVLDHRHLNDVLDFNPTAELQAKYLVEKIRHLLDDQLPEGALIEAAVSETPKTWSTYAESEES